MLNPQRPRRRPLATLLGPAFVASVAYVDPGNVAANLSAGAGHGYLLVWVLVAANLMAVLIQYLSAKLGLVTGRSLAEVIGDRLPRSGRVLYWIQAQLVAIATDLAEVVGGALALKILFDVPMLFGGVIVGIVSIVLLVIQERRGARPFEVVVSGLLAVITLGFLAGLVVVDVSWPAAIAGLEPRFDGPGTVLLAASMLGATVMPHAIYAHSALARDRHLGGGVSLGRLLKATRVDVLASLALAGSVNIGMLLLAAAALRGVPGTDTIEGAHAAIAASLGPAAAALFGLGLLASGLASSSVGAYAGSSIMSGLLRTRLPLVAQRVLTLLPALVVIAIGVEPTRALVLSQVVLSLGIPFALVPLATLTQDRHLMGQWRNATWTRCAIWVVAALIVALNLTLLVLMTTG